MGKYAQGTQVPAERSRAEVERLLAKYKADQFSSGWVEGRAVVMFRMRDRYVRIDLPLPKVEPAAPSWNQKKGLFYSEDKCAAETRRRWRSLVLYIKSKLDSIDSGIVSFESAFMAHLVLPNKQTVGEFMQPQIDAAYGSGEMPKQLPGY